MMMVQMRRFSKTAALLAVVAALLPTNALAFDLTGAWASQADLCRLVFTKKGNTVAFTELSDLYGSGFVVDGNRVKGKAAECTITSRKQEGENIELAASCATSIMDQKVHFNLKVVDDNTIIRDFQEIPGMTLRYSRCKF
jgi:hypothetical protein